MPKKSKSFEALLTRIQEGDEAALAELVEQHRDIIRRAIRGLLGQPLRSQFDSMDLFQSLHCSLLVGLRDHKFDISTPEKLIALSLTLIRRNIAHRWRKLKKKPESDPQIDSDALVKVPADTPEHDDPARKLLTQEMLAQILNGLDDLDRQLVELRLQGLNTAEAARCLGVSPGSLRVRWGRLRKRLREGGLFADQGGNIFLS